jgi:hypothetical protein
MIPLAQRIIKSREMMAIPAPMCLETTSRISLVKGGLVAAGWRGDVSLICLERLASVKVRGIFFFSTDIKGYKRRAGAAKESRQRSFYCPCAGAVFSLYRQLRPVV